MKIKNLRCLNFLIWSTLHADIKQYLFLCFKRITLHYITLHYTHGYSFILGCNITLRYIYYITLHVWKFFILGCNLVCNYLVCNKSLRLIVKKEYCFDVGNYWSFLQGPLPVANYTRIMIPGSSWTCPPPTKNTRMASSVTPPHDSLIELANPHAHAHALTHPYSSPVWNNAWVQ